MREWRKPVLSRPAGSNLYEHETITGKEFMKIFREIKGIPEPEEEKGKKSFMEQAMEAERAESPEIFNGTAGHDGE